ncbi:MAG: hypothetical protein L0226_07830 [Acidobacteria bacterium]|nr:hypothetical protein [Acidobacteriota bacterium]
MWVSLNFRAQIIALALNITGHCEKSPITLCESPHFLKVWAPLIAVTLLHRKGYFHQLLDASGW